jgi:hypothetical protein
MSFISIYSGGTGFSFLFLNLGRKKDYDVRVRLEFPTSFFSIIKCLDINTYKKNLDVNNVLGN